MRFHLFFTLPKISVVRDCEGCETINRSKRKAIKTIYEGKSQRMYGKSCSVTPLGDKKSTNETETHIRRGGGEMEQTNKLRCRDT